MEGKALLFKLFGGVDAVPLCIRAREADDIVRAVEMIEPSFGGVNLEDIAQPSVLRSSTRRVGGFPFRSGMTINRYRDGGPGGSLAALEVVGKSLDRVRVVLFGAGAANVASYRLLTAYGLDPKAIIVCDTKGILHAGRSDIERQKADFADKWRICLNSNGDDRRGLAADAFRGADVCIAFSRSGPGVILPEWIRTMNRDAVVLGVRQSGAGNLAGRGARCRRGHRRHRAQRFSQPGQQLAGVSGIFRGVLDVRARSISDRMAFAAPRNWWRQPGKAVSLRTGFFPPWTTGRSRQASRLRPAAPPSRGARPHSIAPRRAGEARARHDRQEPAFGGAAGGAGPDSLAALTPQLHDSALDLEISEHCGANALPPWRRDRHVRRHCGQYQTRRAGMSVFFAGQRGPRSIGPIGRFAVAGCSNPAGTAASVEEEAEAVDAPHLSAAIVPAAPTACIAAAAAATFRDSAGADALSSSADFRDRPDIRRSHHRNEQAASPP